MVNATEELTETAEQEPEEKKNPEDTPQDSDIRRQARAAAEQVIAELKERADPPGTLSLSNGIILKISAPPQNAITRAASKIPKPEPPDAFDESKGRSEPNPLDPDYVKRLEEWETAQYIAAGDVALLMGTECMSVPDGFHRPEESGWISYLRLLGLDEGIDLDDPVDRYWAWLRYYALRTADDVSCAVYAPLFLGSLSEEEVALAVASFRRRKGWGSDRVGIPAQQGGDRDFIPPALSGIRERARTEGGRSVLDDSVADVEGAPAG